MMQKIKLDVIGDPIGHSKSPIVHSTVLEELGIDFEYSAICVKPGGLREYIDRVHKEEISGFNITMPHKRDIMEFLDCIEPEALRFASVNTVKVKDGRLFGYNTDGVGFVQGIYDRGFQIDGKNIVILGAGGVASTVALKCQFEGAKKISVLNRTLSSAQAITQRLYKCETEALPLSTDCLSSVTENCDILVNATPLGMAETDADFEDFSFFDRLKSGALVYDLIYNPEETNFLKEAKKRGFDTINGLDMLIYQGLLADQIFLDKTLDFPDLKEKIKAKLKNF